MKINTQNQSRFLSRHDLDTPLVVTMDRVTEDATLRNPQVLHFAPAHRLKPFPMNVTNRRILVAAYGDDPAAWHGRPVELYFNPSIPNPRTPEQPGGICVRIPAAAPIGTRPGSSPAPKPAPARPAAATKLPSDLAAKHAQVLAGLDDARTAHNADEWARWGRQFAFTEAQHAEQRRHHDDAMERTALSDAPAGHARRPATSEGRR